MSSSKLLWLPWMDTQKGGTRTANRLIGVSQPIRVPQVLWTEDSAWEVLCLFCEVYLKTLCSRRQLSFRTFRNTERQRVPSVRVCVLGPSWSLSLELPSLSPTLSLEPQPWGPGYTPGLLPLGSWWARTHLSSEPVVLL